MKNSVLPIKDIIMQNKNKLRRTKTENPVARKIAHTFSFDNSIAKISLYALSWPKLNFGRLKSFLKL